MIATSERGTLARWRRRAGEALSGNRGDLAFKGVALFFTLLILLLGALMLFEVLRNSRESIAAFGFFSFITSTDWNPVTREFGAFHVLVGTVVSSLIAVLIAVPVAVGIALFITELAPRWARGPVAFLVDILAAIPSIVYGMWGFFVLAPIMAAYANPFLVTYFGWLPLFSGDDQPGVHMLTAGLILAIMIVPIISAIAREVIFQVPIAQPEGMLALGATRWETIWQVILPFARTGIVGAVILGLARAIGETMAVTMVIGNRHELTANLLAPNATMASTIASEFREATFDLHLSALIHIGLVLMILSLVVNSAARALVWSVARGASGQVR